MQQILAAIHEIAAHCDSYWLPADHVNSALDDFGGILGLLFHGSIFSKDEASTKLGTVHAGYIDYEQVIVLLTAPTLAALG